MIYDGIPSMAHFDFLVLEEIGEKISFDPLPF